MEHNLQDNLNLDLNTINNNRTTKITEDVSLELKHSKFCFSKDISEKEESLRSPRMSTSFKTEEIRSSQPCKKTVTFDSQPVYSDEWKNEFQNFASDSEFDLRDTFGFPSETESSSPSESDLFGTTIADCTTPGVILKAEAKLTPVLARLQALCLDKQDSESMDGKPFAVKETNKENALLRTVSQISHFTDQLSALGYGTCTKISPNQDLVRKLQNSNEIQDEKLKNSKNKIECLESEIKYFSKENALLNAEVKELAYKMATTYGYNKCTIGKSVNFGLTKPESKSPKTEVFYRNPLQQFQASDSNSSATAGVENQAEINLNSTQLGKTNNIMNTCRDTKSSQTGTIFTGNTGMISDNFDEIIRIAKHTINNSSLYAADLKDLQTYDEQIQRIMNSTAEEKQQILSDLETLIHQHKTLLKERDNYEFILKLIMNEKSSSESSLESLLQTLINNISTEDGSESCTKTSLLEGAVQALQNQNSAQREELYRVKHQFSEVKECNESLLIDLEGALKKIAAISQNGNYNEQDIESIHQEAEKKYEKLKQLYNAVSDEKEALEESLLDKEDEMKHLNDGINSLEKTNSKQLKKIHEFHKANTMLTTEIVQLKGNMDHLACIISKLRSSLKDQKSQLSERIRLNSEEASQNKEHCNWLKSQIEHMNQQLNDAHEHLKANEMDKAQLAQQVLLAEEERRVVDRKLQELRSALQGDTGMREALIERNEALQTEINRLRQSKLNSITGGVDNIEDYFPPMEMKAVNDLISSVKILQPAEKNTEDKLLAKKNVYTSAMRRVNDVPKIAVSLHNGGRISS